MTRANLDWLADPAPGGYPGWRGSTRRSVRYTGRTSLTVAMSCPRVEHHTVYRVPIDQTDGDRPSREGIYPDPGEYRGRPQLLYRATLPPLRECCGFFSFFLFTGSFVLYRFGRICNLGLLPFTV